MHLLTPQSLLQTLQRTSVPATSVAPTDISAAATTVASTDTTVAPTDTTIAPTDTSTLVGSVPTGTPVVVLDATGTPVPLATQAAADILNTGDPIWCPGSYGNGTYSLPGDSTCAYASYTSSTNYTGFSTFGGPDGLLVTLRTNPTSYNGNGTIYIEYNYDPATAGNAPHPDSSAIIIDANYQGYDAVKNPEDGNLDDLDSTGWVGFHAQHALRPTKLY